MMARPLMLLLWVACAAIAQPVSAAEEAPPAPFQPVARRTPAHPSNPLRRLPRITAELVLGGASAAGMAYGGYQLGCALSGASFSANRCAMAGFYGGVAGFSLGIPVGVMLGGALLDGDGAVAPTVLGAGFGLAAMVGGLVLIQSNAPDVNPAPLAALPLVFAVAGYELSSHDSRAAVQAEAKGKRASLLIVPSAAVVPDGFALGFWIALP